ncbi:DUF6152 family protein [Asticcacaulis sp.]|uniref:DUF6152 family protein n=1 Tax=Asticcacaulis sp. TaxID=1872648 RepID=UPI002BC487A8|nr:DUF6152 family protein [Asticcacaulis sp.]HTM81599.1 DUF6152 family protein [Asticcacaulis sp.]
MVAYNLKKSQTRMRRMAAVAIIAMASVATAVAGLAPVPALAHHSFAGFDKSRKVTVKGVVKQWQFTNPHSWLQVVVQESGRDVEYSIEGPSVNTLARRGWGRSTFKVGDQVSVTIYPSISGQKSGAFLTATLPNGKSISSGITPN